jgi:hypothetical protein
MDDCSITQMRALPSSATSTGKHQLLQRTFERSFYLSNNDLRNNPGESEENVLSDETPHNGP